MCAPRGSWKMSIFIGTAAILKRGYLYKNPNNVLKNRKLLCCKAWIPAMTTGWSQVTVAPLDGLCFQYDTV